MWPVCKSAVRCADGHEAIAFRIPDQSEPWIELLPVVTVGMVADRVLRIAGEDQSCRRLRVYDAVPALGKEPGIEMLPLRPSTVYREVRLPSHAEVHSQLRGHLPGVLVIQSNVVLAVIGYLRIALKPAGHITQ